jgi:predicted Zn-dependent protease
LKHSATINAIYQDAGGQSAAATILYTSITLTFQLTDGLGRVREHHWLVKDLSIHKEGSTFILQNQLDKWRGVTLVIPDSEVSAPLQKMILRRQRSFFKSPLRKVAAILLLVIGLVIGGYLWLLPWVADKVALSLSKEYEITLGEQIYRQTLLTGAIDTGRSKIINHFFEQLHLPHEYPVKITVMKGEVINAFALPGGPIIVYDALLESIRTPEELAALLAHELSHIEQRHTLRNMAGAIGRRIIITFFVGGQSDFLGMVAGQADALKGLQYSRQLETEADDKGMDLLSRRQIDPEGMLLLIQLLQKETGGQEEYSFLSTHPVFKDRIQNIKQKIASLPRGGDMTAAARLAFHELYE